MLVCQVLNFLFALFDFQQISPSIDVLQFGEVMWGGCVVKTIKLRNVKRAALPVRLSIWSVSKDVYIMMLIRLIVCMIFL